MPITVNGTGNSDKLDYSSKPVPNPVPINKLGGSDYQFNLLAGNDTLIGSPNSDLVYGGTGKDMITGGAGNDVYIDGPLIFQSQSDNFVGGLDTDLFVYTKPFKPGNFVAEEGLSNTPGFSEFYLIDKSNFYQVKLRNDVEQIAFYETPTQYNFTYTLKMGQAGLLWNDTLTGINIDYLTDPDDLDPLYINKDMFFPGEGNDTVLGGWGDDVIFNEVDGTQGSDYYDGGEDKYYSDFDMVIYQESLANAKVSAINMGVGKDPKLLVRIGDRLDTIVNVEQVWFGGAAYDPSYFL